MSEIEKTTLLSIAMAQLDKATVGIETNCGSKAKAAIDEAKKMIAEVYDRQMADDDK